MIRRVWPLLLVGALTLCGLAGAEGPPPSDKDKGDGPLRLKRKKRDGAPPPVVKDKDEEPEKKGDPKKAKPKDKPEPRLQPEEGPPAQEEDDKEVLERIGRNMRAVEEKLGNREVGEPTRQQQRDILDDIDRLLKKSEQQQDQDQDQNQDQDRQPQAGGDQQKQQKQKQQMSRQQKSGKQQGRQKQRRQLRNERDRDKDGKQQQGKENKGQEKQGDKPEPEKGNKPGAGGNNGAAQERDLTADLYKNIWGHLPESLRAEMNAYSNPSPFLPRYDRVISEYYKTIARQGRKKGD
jgi:hypothetical protein